MIRSITFLAGIPICRKLILLVAFRVSLVSMTSNMERKASEVSKKASELSKMQTAEFAQFAMQERIAPKALGLVKVRLPRAQSILGRCGWTKNRVRDLWYLDPRAAEPTWEEITDLEQITGLKYARQELRSTEQLIAQADALLMGTDPDFIGAFVAALRAFFGAPDRSGTQGRGE